MTSNFCVLILLLSLVCYATLGGRNENGQSIDETMIYEQIIEESELVAEEINDEIETEFVEETEYVTSCPSEEIEEVIEDIETPLDCGCKKAKRLIRSPTAKQCPKVRPTPCPCYATRDSMQMGHDECAARVSTKPRIVKRIIKKVIPSVKYSSKNLELETCGSTVESSNEEISSENVEKPVDETKKNEHLEEQQPKVEPLKEKAGEQNVKGKLDTLNKQAKQKNEKSKNQNKVKEQKSGNKKSKSKSNKKSKQ